MINENTIYGTTWIDLTSPTKQDMENILQKYSLTIPTKTILDFEMLPQLQTDSRAHYCILRFPRIFRDKTNEHRTSFEVDFIIAENLLISIHDIPLFEIHSVRTHLSKDDTQQVSPPTSSLSLFGIIITEFYATIRRQLHEITERLEKIELEVYESFERQTITKISKAAKHLIDIERSIDASAPAIKQILQLNESVNSKNITLATNLYTEIKSLLATNRVILNELRLTHQNMIAFNTSNTIRNLTVITFLTLPLSVFVDVFNFYTHPVLATGRNTILMGIAVITVLLILFFRQKKWL